MRSRWAQGLRVSSFRRAASAIARTVGAEPVRRGVACVLLGAAAAFLFAYWAEWIPRLPGWGGRALAHVRRGMVPLPRLLLAGAMLAVLGTLLVGRPGAVLASRSRLLQAAAAGLFGGFILYLFRDESHTLGDSSAILRDAAGSVTNGGFYTYLEELVGMWLPTRLARWRHEAAGTDARRALLQAYTWVSIGAGVLYVAAVSLAARRAARPAAFCTILLLNAALQHFAGYVENYQTATLLLAIGFLWATDRLRSGLETGMGTVLGTTALFSLAVTCHGVAVWSVGALAWLAAVAARGHPLRFARFTVAGTAVAAVILGGVYLLFTRWLTPGVSTVHLGGGDRGLLDPAWPMFLKGWNAMMAHRPLRDHAWAIARVAAPSLLVLAALLLTVPRAVGRAAASRDGIFALAFLAGFLVHQGVWVSKIGLERDWDLFGFTWLPLAYLAWRAFAEADLPRIAEPLVAVVSLLGGFTWVLAHARVTA